MTKNVFANFISEAMLHKNQRADGREFINISFTCPQSKTGYATVAVNLGQVLDATKKDGTVVPGYKSILLGEADKTRKVSICSRVTKTGKKTYKTVEMTNKEIVDCITEGYKAYKSANADAAEEPAA